MLDQSRDLQLIFQRYKDKALKGNRFAMMYVADCFLYGWGTTIDINQYKNCLNQAAMLGSGKACERLFYEALAAQNFPEVERILSIWVNRKSVSMLEDFFASYERTMEIYNSLPQKNVQGMLEAFSKDKNPSDWDCTIAMCYQFGFGVEKNSEKAADIIVNYLGTQYDFPDEIATLVGLYDIGEIPQTQISEHLFNEMCKLDTYNTLDSAERPNVSAGYTERLMIFAACAGNVNSQIQMADLYLDSDIGPINNGEYTNDVEALRWLLVSLENGGDRDDVIAPLLLLADKLGKKRDYENAFKACYALAHQGIIPAQRMLGTYYYRGDGVNVDFEKAGQWWLKAAKNGEETAVEYVNEIVHIGNGDFWRGIDILKETANKDTYTSNSSGGQTRSSGGCYVATCVYGSYDCPEVWTLRRFRDYYLTKSWYGRLFIKIYYATSPTIVRIFGDCSVFKKICRIPLDKMVFRLREKGYKSTKYNDKNWD